MCTWKDGAVSQVITCWQNYIQPHRRGTTKSSLSPGSQSSCPASNQKALEGGVKFAPSNTTTYLWNQSENPRNQSEIWEHKCCKSVKGTTTWKIGSVDTGVGCDTAEDIEEGWELAWGGYTKCYKQRVAKSEILEVWIKKSCYIHTVEYYSATKTNEIF